MGKVKEFYEDTYRELAAGEFYPEGYSLESVLNHWRPIIKSFSEVSLLNQQHGVISVVRLQAREYVVKHNGALVFPYPFSTPKVALRETVIYAQDLLTGRVKGKSMVNFRSGREDE
jgi:hypothetical protein